MTFSKMDIQYTWWNLTKIHQDILKSPFPNPMIFGYPPASFFKWKSINQGWSCHDASLGRSEMWSDTGMQIFIGSWYQNLSDPHFFKVEFFWKFRQITKQTGFRERYSHKWPRFYMSYLEPTFFFVWNQGTGLGKRTPSARGKGTHSQLGERASWEIDVKHKKTIRRSEVPGNSAGDLFGMFKRPF